MKNRYFLLPFACLLLMGVDDCDSSDNPKSASGVSKATVKVQVGPDGLTTEQRNIRDRLRKDNEPGAIKHLYVISAYSGQVLIYSTVRGKVTSGAKRMTPTSASDCNSCGGAFRVDVGGDHVYTTEVLQDDGTYGHSMDYLYWTDVNGIYHQHYVTGGQILHISDQPLAVKSVVINMEVTAKPAVPHEPQ